MDALPPFVDRHALAGAVTLVASREKVLELSALGWADVAAHQPMAPDTLFWIASMTKPITGTLLMMLVDEGKVNVEDPVENYLPEFKGQMLITEKTDERVVLRRPAHPITVRNALTHTGGLPFSSPIEQPTLDLHPLRTAVRSYAMLPLQFEPDTQYQYSNAGTNTAGRLIEVVSGVPYQDFLKERLLEPLGMKDTTFWPEAAQLRRLAKPYKPDAANTGLEETVISQLRYPLDDLRRQPIPAGGLFSTASDLERFCQMILHRGALDGRRYLSEAAVAQMTGKQTGGKVGEGYGFGWAVGEGSCGHGGALATHMTIHWAPKLITIFLVQHAGFPGDGVNSHAVFQQAALERYGG